MLSNKAEFQDKLKNYRPNLAALENIQQSHLAFLISPSGVGRNTIIDFVVDNYQDYNYIVSETTRRPRVNNGVAEVSGKEYSFVSETEMLHKIDQKQLLEFAIIHDQQVSGIAIDSLIQTGYLLAEIEDTGSLTIKQLLPQTKHIFVLPPDYQTWMDRLRSRGDMSETEFKNRMRSAQKELNFAKNNDYLEFIINDNYRHAGEQLVAGLNGEKEFLKRELALELINHLQESLNEIN